MSALSSGTRARRWRLALAPVLGLGLVLGLFGACAEYSRRGVQRYDREQLAATLADPSGSELVIGVFPLAKGGVVDGDTIRVGGLDETLRLLALDTEETFKSESARRAYEVGWAEYLASEKAKTSRPVKIPTPLGEDAKKFAKEFFKGVRSVRLERDHPKEIRGRFNRYLSYVFVEREGEWVNYNLEAVRAGMSPYFTKYAYSRRFHEDFVAAQAEARAAERGIWAPGAEHYDDYPLRLEWWDARADFIAAFEAEAEGREDMIVLTHWDATQRLSAMVDREVEVLATVGDVRRREGKRPARAMLSRRMFADLPLIFWEDEVLDASHIADFQGEFVSVRGLVTRYVHPKSGEEILQIEVRLPRQVRLPDYLPPGKAPEVLEREVDRPYTETEAPEIEPEPAPEPTPEAEPEATPEAEPEATPEPESRPAPEPPEIPEAPPATEEDLP